jgi:uncharacterized protein (TIGR01777 family)
MKIAITGATGTIGRELLASRDHSWTALSRDPERAGLDVPVHAWPDPQGAPPPLDALRGCDAVIHLLGETVAQRWTDDAMREIRDSRVLGTRNLVAALRELPEADRPSVLVSQSASGYYGPRGPEPVDEASPAGDDFLARVVVEWEAEALAAEELGMRVVLTRTGVVLSQSGGALAKMLPFFKLGIGGPVAGGRQYVPWVHLDDVVGALLFCAATAEVSGPVNVSAPEPVSNGELSKTLGRVLRRPAFLPVPGVAVRTLYGSMATIVTTGVRAVPAALLMHGYSFRQPELEAALRDATGRAGS